MLKILDKIWMWNGWAKLKWVAFPFWIWALIVVIWNLETRPNYDQELINKFKSIHVDFTSYKDILKVNRAAIKNVK